MPSTDSLPRQMREEIKRDAALKNGQIARKYLMAAMKLWDELDAATPRMQIASAVSCVDDAADTGSNE